MVGRAAVTRHERVLEIGTGKGAVTKQLCKVSEDVEAFEVDTENFRVVKALGLRGLTLHLGDAFSEPRNFDVLVSSLPYSESSTFVEWLAKLKYDRAVVMLQKDFVDKLTAVPGDDRYRAVSVISQISSNVESLRTVEKASFRPPPRVASVVALITPNRLLSAKEIGLIKLIFSQKKRRLGGVLKRLGLETADPTWRASPERVERLTAHEVVSVLESIKSSL